MRQSLKSRIFPGKIPLYLGIDRKNTYAFGDSNNDLSMFEYAAYKVAMGNSSKKILSLADYVTEDMFHYGIRNGLVHLGLI